MITDRTKAQLLNSIDKLARSMITDRSQADIDYLRTILKLNRKQMSNQQRNDIQHPMKGAYNPTDMNRVSNYCNDFVELMSRFYGTNTPSYSDLPVEWFGIMDPTKNDLENYINNILIFKGVWCNIMEIPDEFPIDHIYEGITLETANNIERALLAIHEVVNKYIFSIDSRYCGQLYGPDSSSVLVCGYALQNDSSQYGIWTGAN